MLYKVYSILTGLGAVRWREDGDVAKLHRSGLSYIIVGQITVQILMTYRAQSLTNTTTKHYK